MKFTFCSTPLHCWVVICCASRNFSERLEAKKWDFSIVSICPARKPSGRGTSLMRLIVRINGDCESSSSSLISFVEVSLMSKRPSAGRCTHWRPRVWKWLPVRRQKQSRSDSRHNHRFSIHYIDIRWCCELHAALIENYEHMVHGNLRFSHSSPGWAGWANGNIISRHFRIILITILVEHNED